MLCAFRRGYEDQVHVLARAERWLRLGYWRARGRWFDYRLGVRTEEVITKDATVAGGTPYQPTDMHIIRQLSRRMRPGAADVVLDLGSGLGRVVLAVARHAPVSAVIGVEADRRLHELAVRNAAAAKKWLRCKDIRLYCADAGEFVVPDEVTCVYLFNPFGDVVLGRVLTRIAESLERRRRPLAVVYFCPVHGDLLREYGFTRTVVRPYLHVYRR